MIDISAVDISYIRAKTTYPTSQSVHEKQIFVDSWIKIPDNLADWKVESL